MPDGVREDLGIADLRSGSYTQMRLIIGDEPDDSINLLSLAHPFANYVVDNTDNAHELKIPSGLNTGIKVVKGFTVSTDRTTELILDFDANRSVVEAGRSGQKLLKPTITVQDAAEYAIIEGVVRAAEDDSVVAGVVVSAQAYDSGAADPADAVTLRAATISDATGEYRLFVAPGTYSLVAYADGYAAAVEPITLHTGETLETDFSLADASIGTIDGDVDLFEPDHADQYATLSFRQAIAGGAMVEIKMLNTQAGAFTVDLPVGEIEIVVSSAGYTTETDDLTVPGSIDITLYP